MWSGVFNNRKKKKTVKFTNIIQYRRYMEMYNLVVLLTKVAHTNDTTVRTEEIKNKTKNYDIFFKNRFYSGLLLIFWVYKMFW